MNIGTDVMIEIAHALASTASKRATAGTLAFRLNKSALYVRAVLDAMCKDGYCRREPAASQIAGNAFVYILVRIPVAAREAKPPRPAVHAASSGDPDWDTVEFSDHVLNCRNAEMEWRARMGPMRWRDDPRALTERTHPVNLHAPF